MCISISEFLCRAFIMYTFGWHVVAMVVFISRKSWLSRFGRDIREKRAFGLVKLDIPWHELGGAFIIIIIIISFIRMFIIIYAILYKTVTCCIKVLISSFYLSDDDNNDDNDATSQKNKLCVIDIALLYFTARWRVLQLFSFFYAQTKYRNINILYNNM